jgi:hypothetical protein
VAIALPASLAKDFEHYLSKFGLKNGRLTVCWDIMCVFVKEID